MGTKEKVIKKGYIPCPKKIVEELSSKKPVAIPNPIAMPV